MKPKTFAIILLTVLTVAILITAFHLISAIYAYQHCSVIGFIAGELW